jgi:glycosyltransferase involved in cell wall biosynthesis
MTAAAQMPDVRFALSGPAVHYQGGPDTIPPNVELTGFLPGPDYWRLLQIATVVCDLTLKPDCLVCGAYEALAAGKPMVLSDNPATRAIFEVAAVLTENVPEQIVSAIRAALAESEALGASARQLQESYSRRWQKEADAAWDIIVTESGHSPGTE